MFDVESFTQVEKYQYSGGEWEWATTATTSILESENETQSSESLPAPLSSVNTDYLSVISPICPGH